MMPQNSGQIIYLTTFPIKNGQVRISIKTQSPTWNPHTIVAQDFFYSEEAKFLFVPKVNDRNHAVVTDDKRGIISDGVDLVVSARAGIEWESSTPNLCHFNIFIDELVDVEDNRYTLLVLRVGDVVELGDDKEVVGQVDVVQVEVS